MYHEYHCVSIIQIMKHSKTLVTVKRSSAGLGLFASQEIKKGTSIIEYTGEIITRAEADRRGNKYLFETSSNRVIDGSGRDNIARYANHACKPNSEIDIKRGRVYIIAKKNIPEGDEITYDYDSEYFEEYIKPFGCRCATCSHTA